MALHTDEMPSMPLPSTETQTTTPLQEQMSPQAWTLLGGAQMAQTEKRLDDNGEGWIPWRNPLDPIPGLGYFPRDMPIKQLNFDGASTSSAAVLGRGAHTSELK